VSSNHLPERFIDLTAQHLSTDFSHVLRAVNERQVDAAYN